MRRLYPSIASLLSLSLLLQPASGAFIPSRSVPSRAIPCFSNQALIAAGLLSPLHSVLPATDRLKASLQHGLSFTDSTAITIHERIHFLAAKLTFGKPEQPIISPDGGLVETHPASTFARLFQALSAPVGSLHLALAPLVLLGSVLSHRLEGPLWVRLTFGSLGSIGTLFIPSLLKAGLSWARSDWRNGWEAATMLLHGVWKDSRPLFNPLERAEGRTQGRYTTVDSRFGVSLLLGPVSNTLKDILRSHGGLKAKKDYILVLPPELLHHNRFYGDIEFLTYFQAFLKGGLGKSQLRVVVPEEYIEGLKKFLEYSLFGADWDKYPGISEEDRQFNTLLREHYSLRYRDGSVIPLEGFVEFIPLSKEKPALIDMKNNKGTLKGKIQVRIADDETAYTVQDLDVFGNPIGAEQDMPITYNQPEPLKYKVPESAKENLKRARYGFARTLLGTSTGFDTEGDPTSMIVWAEGQGLWVDPSHESLQYMPDFGLSESDIPYIYLSHPHQDHDSGVFELILQRSHVKLICADFVYEQFMEKVELMLASTNETINPRELVEHISLNPGKTFKWRLPSGKVAKIKNWRNLHPLTTYGFSVTYDGKSYAHSSDTQWDMKLIDSLAKPDPTGNRQHQLTPKQVKELKWSIFDRFGKTIHDLIDFEMGGPPIHTTLAALSALPEATRSKMYVYHVADKAVPKESGLRKAPMFETHSIIPPNPDTKEAYFKARLSQTPTFYGKEKLLAKFLSREFAKRESIPKGTYLTKEGQFIDYSEVGEDKLRGRFTDKNRVYFLLEGSVRSKKGTLAIVPFQWVGNWAVATHKARTSSLVALEDLEVYSLTPIQYLRLFGDDKTNKHVGWVQDHIATLRKWISQMTGDIPTDLPDIALALLAPGAEMKVFKPGEDIVTEGDTDDEFFVLIEGSAEVYRNNKTELLRTIRGEGSYFGEISVLRQQQRSATVTAGPNGMSALVMTGQALRQWADLFPGALVALERRAIKNLEATEEAGSPTANTGQQGAFLIPFGIAAATFSGLMLTTLNLTHAGLLSATLAGIAALLARPPRLKPLLRAFQQAA